MTFAWESRWHRRRLGKSELQVPPIALGGAGIGGVYGGDSDEAAISCIHYALENGLNFLDTDASYGESERRLGLALKGVPRDSYILSTKCGTHPDRKQDFSRDGVLWNVENSLRVLGVDYLDLLLVHDPDDMAPVMADDGAFAALHELKSQGVIRAIGLGQRNHAFHAQAIEAGMVDVILTYKDYNPIRTTADAYLLDLAAAHDVGVLNGSPLAMGLLTGTDPNTLPQNVKKTAEDNEFEASKRLYQWCQERGVSEPAVVLQFSLRQPRIHSTVIGAKNREEIDRDLQSALDPLPDEIWEELEALHLTEGQTQPE
jgi:aryl-alcohol dehydrogenase-like predicted oxidoreductase